MLTSAASSRDTVDTASSKESVGRVFCSSVSCRYSRGLFPVLFQPTLAIKIVCSAQVFQKKETLKNTRTSLSWRKMVNLMGTWNSKPWSQSEELLKKPTYTCANTENTVTGVTKQYVCQTEKSSYHEKQRCKCILELLCSEFAWYKANKIHITSRIRSSSWVCPTTSQTEDIFKI